MLKNDSWENFDFKSLQNLTSISANWNKKVHRNDIVYILGDLMFRNQKAPEEYLQQLKGKKHLLLGNHDNRWIKDCNLSLYFESVEKLEFMFDGKRHIAVCHYPMMSWPHNQKGFMVFGHIHNNIDADYWPLIAQSERMLKGPCHQETEEGLSGQQASALENCPSVDAATDPAAG